MKQLIRKISVWEEWPFKLIYAPLVPVWLYYMLKSRAVWFFTPSNPKLTFGGLDGETKFEMYSLLPKPFYPEIILVNPKEPFEKIVEKIKQQQFVFPFVVKPDVGMQGILFRVIENEAALEHYHKLMPVTYIIQKMLVYPMEVSVFYIRYPNQLKGKITGFLHKIPLSVIGDGVQTLAQLIQKHPKAIKRMAELKSKHKTQWDSVIPKDAKYSLCHAANHNRGAHFVDLRNEIDENLIKVFDDISLGINDFFYGRYDIMCKSVSDLKAGNNFSILEYNGCGAEPNHFYDTGYTLLGAYQEILKHWKDLYEISKYNAQQNIKPWPLLKGLRFRMACLKHINLLKKVDKMIN